MNTLPTSMKKLKEAFNVLVIMLFSCVLTTGQAQTLTLGSVLACSAPEVVLPVTGTNLVNISSITLFITFDSTQLTYQSVENVDPQLNGILYSLNTTPFQLVIVWSKVSPVDFIQKKLFDIRFAYKGKTSSVTFKQNCEISNNQLQILPVNYISGSVVAEIFPEITLQPKDTTVKPWAHTTFTTNASNNPNFIWKESTDNGQTWSDLSDNSFYEGTHTPQLSLAYAPPAFNKYQYICNLNTQHCTSTTLSAILTVDTLASISGYAAENDFLMQNKPNPLKEFTIIEYSLPDNGSVTLEILDICGKLVGQPVREIQVKGTYKIHFEASVLSPGIYFYKLVFKNQNSGFTACRKMIKQFS
jgi:hypothetical protein